MHVLPPLNRSQLSEGAWLEAMHCQVIIHGFLELSKPMFWFCSSWRRAFKNDAAVRETSGNARQSALGSITNLSTSVNRCVDQAPIMPGGEFYNRDRAVFDRRGFADLL